MAKVELTPEELADKKVRRSNGWTRFWAIVLALVLVAGTTVFATNKAKTANEEAAAEAESRLAEQNAVAVNSNSTQSWDDGGSTSSGDSDAATPASDEAEDAAKAINAATAAAVSAGYDWARKCDISNIDVGGQSKTDAINSVIKRVDSNADINSVVGGFIGKGDKKETIAKGEDAAEKIGYQGANYALKATTLKGADLKGLAQDGDTYTFTLEDVSNPQKDDSTALARLTNDFITQSEVAAGIADALPSLLKSAITLKSSDVLFKNIKVTVVITDGKLVSLSYSYDMVVNKLELNLATGTGNGTVNASYSNFVY